MTLTSEPTAHETLAGLDGFLPAGTQLLASCFDAHHTIGGGLFALGSGIEAVDRVSSSGLHAENGLLYRCLWSADGSPAELVVYDTGGIRRYHRLDGVSTPHDILVTGENVLVVATMQNEVQCVTPTGEVAWRWRAPGEPDSWHLNSLARYGDKVVVCGFGPFLRRRGWDANGKPASGRVVDMTTGEPILQGLRAPHNPWYHDGTWLVCDSAAGDVVELSDATREETRRLALPGWPRGLVVTDDHLFVGLSPHRHASRSVDTAAVAVIDRADWRLTGVAALPAREIYALTLASDTVVEGAQLGFANHTRVHEQGQRQLFDRLGVQPRRLWAIGDLLAEDERRVRLTPGDEAADEVEAGTLLTVECLVQNTGSGVLTSAPPFPVRVVHRWYDESGEEVPTQPITAALPQSLPPQAVVRVPVRARVPGRPGRYRLRITPAQDGAAPFDHDDEANATDLDVVVAAEGVGYEALSDFGLYPAEIWEKRAAGTTVEDMVRALLTKPDGSAAGLALGLIEQAGRPTFVAALAKALSCTSASIEHLVADVLDGFGEPLLTGAEAIALGLRRAGVRVVFAYAGTSELALCDATARLGLLVNGRGDRESLFEAGGASRLRPGTGAAILHGARGLTNALGALADLRRNEMGTLAVVGMPSTGSQPFLPPHGEHSLISASGTFAKSWYELGAVPKDAAGRAAAVETFVDALTKSIEDTRRAPFGPVLLAIPQDVSEATWVPLSALPALSDRAEPAVPDEESVAAAAELLGAARRAVVFLDDFALAHEGVRPALADFCRKNNAPVLQVKYRRGPMLFERLGRSDVPSFLGWYDPADPRHRAVLAGADLLVTVEDRNMYPRVIGELPPCRKIAITSKPAAAQKNGYLREGDVVVAGDVVSSLRALTRALGDRPGTGSWYSGQAGPVIPAEHVPPAAAKVRSGIANAIATAVTRLPKPAVLVDDSQMFGGVLAEEYDSFPAGLRIFGGHGGFVGSGITVATGLALGEPATKVLCSLGDQGFTNSMQGLVAAVQESAPVTFLVCNNGGAVSLRKQSRPAGWLDTGRDTYLANAEGMDYTKLAGALGVRSLRVDLRDWTDDGRTAAGLDAFAEALETATAHQGPSLIELMLPSDPEFWSGVWINAGFEATKAAAHA